MLIQLRKVPPALLVQPGGVAPKGANLPMQDNPKGAGDENVPPTEAQDIRDQGVVLIHVLTRHPTLLTIPDLVRERSPADRRTSPRAMW
jgi:hypothetical protein